MSRPIANLAVLGAGTMGHGIAHVSAMAGYDVFVFDVNLDAAKAGVEKIRKNLEVGVEKKKVEPAQRDAALARLTATATLSDLRICGLVIEAAPEKMDLKKKLFGELAELCSGDALLATNTSSLSVTEIAAAATYPERVLGMHFFNPVHLMKLLELVKAHQTSDETLARARAFGEKIGKQLVVVNDSPGFASTRLGLVVGLEAIRMLEEGVASAEDIDRAMELGYGYPMGPLKLGDLVGLDVRLAISEYLYQELGSPAFRPPQLLKRMVRAGKLGKKSGQGFYKY
jgi:3-hydroxybutyryl-CoA dehydrogenase